MMDIIKKFFEREEKNQSKGRQRERPHDPRIATCAILLEMANIDGEFSATERENMITILKGHYHIPDEYVDQLIEAANEELEQSVDLWRFTNLINRNYSMEEKRRIIEMVWEIAYRDGRLDKHEDYLMHKLAKLLHLTHKQLIQAKMKVIHGVPKG